ncbi:18736_t:CDS:2, partial [Gigaspora rosea]
MISYTPRFTSWIKRHCYHYFIREQANLKLQKRFFARNGALMKKGWFFETNADKSKSSTEEEGSDGSTTLAGSEVNAYEDVTKVLAVNVATLAEKLGNSFENHNKDILKLSEDHKKDMLDHKKDILKLSEDHKKDILKLSEEKFALSEEKSKLMIRNKEEEIELRDRTARIFKLQRISNVRGALETESEPFKLHEPIDKTLQRLSEQEDFNKCLRETCKVNDVHLESVKKCLAGLYHTSSKALHSRTNEIEICAKDWETNEVIALGVIFKFFRINFIYLDELEKETEYPYEI